MREPLESARPHLDAILPHNPTIRVGRRGRDNDVVLAYYQSPPLNQEASVHIISYASQTPENRVPYQTSLCWPDENGILHFGHPVPERNVILADSTDAPTRFFELTDRFLQRSKDLASALFFKAQLSKPLLATPNATLENIRSSIRLLNEEQQPVDIDYELNYTEISPGKYNVTILTKEKLAGGSPIWAKYPTESTSSLPVWVQEPLYFSSVIEEKSLQRPGPYYELLTNPTESGYLIKVQDVATVVDNGTAFLWRVAGIKDGIRVYTGWFPAWIHSGDSPKKLEDLNVQAILQREHPGATFDGLEQRKLWGGSLNLYVGAENKPYASTDRPMFSGTVPEDMDLVQLVQKADIFLSVYREITETNAWWRLRCRVKRLDVNPNESNPYGAGYGNGIWRIRGAGGYYNEIVDWEHRSIREGYYNGGLHLYGPSRRDWISAEIGIWVPYDVTIRFKMANDDSVTVYINGVQVLHRGSTAYYKALQGEFYDYHWTELQLKRGFNRLYMYVEDRGDKLLDGTDYTGLDWDRALHRALDEAGLNGEYWIGSLPENQTEVPTIESLEVYEGTTLVTWPHKVNVDPGISFGWPVFSWQFVELEFGGSPYLRAYKATDFANSGKFTLELEAPERVPISKTKTVSVGLTAEEGQVRVISFPEVLNDLELSDVDDSIAEKVFVEAISNKDEVAIRFAWASNPLDPSTYRYFTSIEGTSRVSVADLRKYPEGWLLAWTTIPALRISKRYAFRTEDAYRIFVLDTTDRRTPASHGATWAPYIRPGRIVRSMPLPSVAGTDRYNSIPGGSTSLLWVYDVPEYLELTFDPAPPFRRIKANPALVGVDGKIFLPHYELSFNPNPIFNQLDQNLISWISYHSGTIQLTSAPSEYQSLTVEYGARDDAYQYLGYRRNDGKIVSLVLNPSYYQRYVTDQDGEITGHFHKAGEPLVFQPGTSLIGKTITIYALPSRVYTSYLEDYAEVKFEPFNSPAAITTDSYGVIVSNGVLTLQTGQVTGMAYLARWQTSRPVRKARIYSADEQVVGSASIRYEIWNGIKWVEALKGQTVSFVGDLNEVRVRIQLQSSGGYVALGEVNIEAIGYTQRHDELASWNDTIYHTTLRPEELVRLDPLAIPLAVIYVGVHASPNDVLLIDARSRGGGLIEPLNGVSRDELGGYWDIGYWDGKAHLENGIIVVELPATILKEYGGKFTHDEVLEHLNRHLAFGHLVIVRYLGEDGTWINSQT